MSSKINKHTKQIVSEAYFGEIDKIEKKIKNGFNINRIIDQDDDGYTLLTCAIIGRQLALCEKLLELGADINFVNKSNKNLINIFLFDLPKPQRDPKILEFLCKNGCNTEHTIYENNNTPLFICISSEKFYKEEIKILLKYGANTLVTDRNGLKPSHYVGPN